MNRYITSIALASMLIAAPASAESRYTNEQYVALITQSLMESYTTQNHKLPNQTSQSGYIEAYKSNGDYVSNRMHRSHGSSSSPVSH